MEQRSHYPSAEDIRRMRQAGMHTYDTAYTFAPVDGRLRVLHPYVLRVWPEEQDRGIPAQWGRR